MFGFTVNSFEHTMNRFYLFNTWVIIFFIVLTVLFFAASFFYILQLYLLNKKNKRFKKSNHIETSERKLTYGHNIKLAAKLNGNEKILTSIDKKDFKDLKATKKTKRDINKAKTKKSPLCFGALFKSKKKEPIEPYQYSLNENGYFSDARNYYYGDQTDGQAQSYESFETMTTDSECYRDWRHSIDFMSNGILNNQYNNHNNEIMQKAYEQLYAQQFRNSNLTLNRPIRDEISVPVNDLYPVSVVPYDFEPQSIQIYQMNAHNQFYDQTNSKISDNLEFDLEDNQTINKQINLKDTQKNNQKNNLKDNLKNDLKDNLKDNPKDKLNEIHEQHFKDNNQDYDQGYNSSQHLSNNSANLNDHNQIDKVKKKSFDETINKLSTLVSIKDDGKIKQKILTSAEVENLDRNMNLLTQN